MCLPRHLTKPGGAPPSVKYFLKVPWTWASTDSCLRTSMLSWSLHLSGISASSNEVLSALCFKPGRRTCRWGFVLVVCKDKSPETRYLTGSKAEHSECYCLNCVSKMNPESAMGLGIDWLVLRNFDAVLVNVPLGHQHRLDSRKVLTAICFKPSRRTSHWPFVHVFEKLHPRHKPDSSKLDEWEETTKGLSLHPNHLTNQEPGLCRGGNFPKTWTKRPERFSIPLSLNCISEMFPASTLSSDFDWPMFDLECSLLLQIQPKNMPRPVYPGLWKRPHTWSKPDPWVVGWIGRPDK